MEGEGDGKNWREGEGERAGEAAHHHDKERRHEEAIIIIDAPCRLPF
jgi:hypothetical protein